AALQDGGDPTEQVRRHSLGGPSPSADTASTTLGARRGSAHNRYAAEAYLHARESDCTCLDSENRVRGQRSSRTRFGGRRGRRPGRRTRGTDRWDTGRSSWWHRDLRADPTAAATVTEANCSRRLEPEGAAANL